MIFVCTRKLIYWHSRHLQALRTMCNKEQACASTCSNMQLSSRHGDSVDVPAQGDKAALLGPGWRAQPRRSSAANPLHAAALWQSNTASSRAGCAHQLAQLGACASC